MHGFRCYDNVARPRNVTQLVLVLALCLGLLVAVNVLCDHCVMTVIIKHSYLISSRSKVSAVGGMLAAAAAAYAICAKGRGHSIMCPVSWHRPSVCMLV